MRWEWAISGGIERLGRNPLEVTHRTIHRTAIMNLAKTNVGTRIIQMFSSHCTADMDIRYSHVRDGNVDIAIEKMRSKKIIFQNLD